MKNCVERFSMADFVKSWGGETKNFQGTELGRIHEMGGGDDLEWLVKWYYEVDSDWIHHDNTIF